MQSLDKLSDLTLWQANGAFGPHIGAALVLIFSSLALLILPGALVALKNWRAFALGRRQPSTATLDAAIGRVAPLASERSTRPDPWTKAA